MSYIAFDRYTGAVCDCDTLENAFLFVENCMKEECKHCEPYSIWAIFDSDTDSCEFDTGESPYLNIWRYNPPLWKVEDVEKALQQWLSYDQSCDYIANRVNGYKKFLSDRK